MQFISIEVRPYLHSCSITGFLSALSSLNSIANKKLVLIYLFRYEPPLPAGVLSLVLDASAQANKGSEGDISVSSKRALPVRMFSFLLSYANDLVANLMRQLDNSRRLRRHLPTSVFV
jgi:hypothetical protein